MYFTFCYASTYSITFTVTVDFCNLLGYSIIFFSTQRSQSRKCNLHFLHTKHGGLMQSILYQTKLSSHSQLLSSYVLKILLFPHYQVLTEFYQRLLLPLSTPSCQRLKSQKRKVSPMEGSHGEAANRKHQRTDSGSTKAKYFTCLNDGSSCSADNSSQSEDPYVKAKLMVATYLNEPKCKRNVCPLQVQMGQCYRHPEIATIA